jgi:hypothetical protein
MQKHRAHIWTIEENIQLCISSISEGTLHWVASNMWKRVNVCFAERGGYF